MTHRIRNKQGQFIQTNVTVLRAGNRGRNNRKLALHRRTKYPKHPKPFHISHKPRSL